MKTKVYTPTAVWGLIWPSDELDLSLNLDRRPIDQIYISGFL